MQADGRARGGQRVAGASLAAVCQRVISEYRDGGAYQRGGMARVAPGGNPLHGDGELWRVPKQRSGGACERARGAYQKADGGGSGAVRRQEVPGWRGRLGPRGATAVGRLPAQAPMTPTTLRHLAMSGHSLDLHLRSARSTVSGDRISAPWR